MMPPNDDKDKESKPKFDLEEVSKDVTPELPGAEDVDAAFENLTAGDLERTAADKLPPSPTPSRVRKRSSRCPLPRSPRRNR